jgi:hypothetical protein
MILLPRTLLSVMTYEIDRENFRTIDGFYNELSRESLGTGLRRVSPRSSARFARLWPYARRMRARRAFASARLPALALRVKDNGVGHGAESTDPERCEVPPVAGGFGGPEAIGMQPVPWGKTRSHVGDQPGQPHPSSLTMRARDFAVVP